MSHFLRVSSITLHQHSFASHEKPFAYYLLPCWAYPLAAGGGGGDTVVATTSDIPVVIPAVTAVSAANLAVGGNW